MQMIFSRFVRVAVLLGTTAFAPTALLAQSGTSTISGIVKDTSGGTIPGAQVRVVNEDTNVVLDTLTNQEGLYRVGALVPGKYRVEVELSGFEPVIRRPIVLEVGQTLAIDVMLDIARQSEAVDVVASAPVVETQSSNITQTVTREMLAALPLPNRASSSLASLAPGVIMIDTGSGT